MSKQQNTVQLVIVAIVAFAVGYFFAQQSVPASSPDSGTTTDNGSAMEETMGDENGSTMESGEGMMEDDRNPLTEEESNPEDFTLTGYALERGGAHLEWVVPENRREPERFMVVRGDEPNPVHDGSHYWFRQDGSVRELDWKDIPKGTEHFRVCILENDTCVEYTNNIELELR